MFSRSFRRIAVAVLFAVLVFSTAGVWASWEYTGDFVPSYSLTIDVQAFPWEGSEILPDDVVGQNHKQLIDSIIYGTTEANGKIKEIGLNSPKSELNQQISDRSNIGRDTFGSMDVRDSSEMANIFDLDTSNLAFMIHSPADDTDVKYIFTTDGNLGPSSTLLNPKDPYYAEGERIYPIYRTKIIKKINTDGNAVWEPTETIVGSAESAFYANDWFGSWAVKNPAFDVDTFSPYFEEDCESGQTAIKMGETVGNAIWLFDGKSENLDVLAPSGVTYFRYKASSNGTLNFALDVTKGMTVAVYSDSALTKLVGETVTDTLSVKVSRGTTYYVRVIAGSKIVFTVNQK